MPWEHTPEKRRKDSNTYGTQWRKARQAALQRAGHRCQECQSPMRLQVDHVIPVSRGGTHDPANLQVLCDTCHKRKTASEGGGYRSTRHQADPDPTPRTDWD